MLKKAYFIFLFCICSTSFAENCYVHNVMKDILKAHIEHKHISPKILRRSLRVAFDQFDPCRIYLLQEEVDELLEVDEGEIMDLAKGYVKGDFSYFKKIYQTFATAILRARANRKGINGLKVSVRKARDKKYSNFPRTELELSNRQKHHMQLFIRHMGKKKSRSKVLKYYEKRQNFHEKGFLELDQKTFSFRVLKALSRSLDPHTLYYFPEEAEEIKGYLEKGILGIGIVFKENEEGVFIKDIRDDSPAGKVEQIKVKDRLIAVNQQKVEELTLEEIDRIIKMSSRYVSFTLQTEKGEEYEVRLRKEKLEVNDERIDVGYEKYQDGILGRIKLYSFYESKGVSAEMDIKKALRKLKSKGKLKGLVFDLRDNPGGFLTQAVKVAGLFLKSGIVVVCRYSDGEKRYLREMDGRVYYDGPLVILQSKGSASAAEIVAGTLQDYGVGVVVGDPSSFGKATIQYQNITNRTGPSFKVTIGRYYTVSGKSPQLQGVKSDIIVPSNLYHYSIGEKFLHYPLTPDHIDPVFSDPMYDINKRDQVWFEENYIPKMQKQSSFYTSILPKLKEASHRRIDENPIYQEFIRSGDRYSDLEFFNQDYQLYEAFEILKDIVDLKAHSDAKAA